MENQTIKLCRILSSQQSFKIFCVLIFCLTFSQTNFCQQLPCGAQASQTDYETYERKVADLQIHENIVSREDINIAMRAVIFTNSLGYSSTSMDEMIKSIENAKAAYAKQGIIISSCTPIFIKNNTLYKFEKLTETAQLESLVKDNIINVFVTEELASNDVDICGFSTFPYSAGKKYVVLNSLCVNNPSTLIHELGHFFGLYHTHETYFGKEYVSRSNCTDAGDLLCDTPADPLLSSANVNAACTYVGTKSDIFGQAYTPDTKNYMSYSLKSCRDVFSDGQKSITRSVAKQYLDQYAKLCEGNDIGIYTDYKFDTRTVSGATFDLPFEIKSDKFSKDFDYKVIVSVVDKNGEITVLDKKIYSSSKQSFEDFFAVHLPAKLSSGNYLLALEISLPNDIIENSPSDNAILLPFEIDYTHLEGRNVFYNPQTQEIHVFIKNLPLSKLGINVYDTQGRSVMKVEDFQIKTGEYINTIHSPILTSGLYVVVIDNGAESFSGKIVVE